VWSFVEASEVLAETVTSPQTCSVGVYVASLRDFNTANGSFTADFRLWSACPSKELHPLESTQIINVINSRTAYERTLARKNKSDLFQPKDTVYWSQREVSATIFQDWNLRNYPFDRHELKIQFEETVKSAAEFIYTPDFNNSKYDENIDLEDWEITNFSIQEFRVPYATTFGDPEIDIQQSRYSRLVVSIKIQRIGMVSFIKLSIGVYVTAAIMMLSFLLEYEVTISTRLSLLVGALFGALVNMQVADSSLGTEGSVTLVGFIHIITILYILAASGIAFYLQILNEGGHQKQALYLDRQVLFQVFTISFVVVNCIAIGYAAIVG